MSASELGAILAAIISYCTICAFIYKAAETVEKNHLSLTQKMYFGKILLESNLGILMQSTSQLFLIMFDRIFKSKERKIPFIPNFIIPSFWRSCIASIIWVAVLFSIWVATIPDGWTVGYTARDQISDGKDWAEFQALLGFIDYHPVDSDPSDSSSLGINLPLSPLLLMAFSLNLFGDYLSLIESRFIIQKLTSIANSFKILLGLFIDLIFTFGVILFSILISGIFSMIFWEPSTFFKWARSDVIFDIIIVSPQIFVFGPPDQYGRALIGIPILSTFFTSVWIWMYLISSIVFKFFGRAFELGKSFLGNFNPKQRPLTSLAIIIDSFISIIFWPILIYTHFG